MADSGTYIFDDGVIDINSVNLSAWCKSIKVTKGAATLNNTVMGTITESGAGGLLSWTFEVTFEQDFASGGPDATLWPLFQPSTTFTIYAQPTSASASATNPQISGTAILSEYNPLDGMVGELMLCSAKFDCAGVLSHT